MLKKVLDIILLVVLVFAFNSCQSTYESVHRKKYGIAIYDGGTKVDIFHYFVDTSRYGKLGYYFTGIEIGDCFRIAYDSLNPRDSELFEEEPVFLPEEKLIKTTGTLIGVGVGYLSFCYIESDERINRPHYRGQLNYKAIWDTSLSIREGAQFEVQYAASNQKRAILYHDKPISIHNQKIAIGIIKHQPYRYYISLNSLKALTDRDYVYEFYEKGVKYTAIGPVNKYTYNGEKFKVVYDSLNPNISLAYAEEPIFLPTDTTITTTGTITKVNYRACEFSYRENTDKSKRKYIDKKQWYYAGTAQKLHLKKGQKFEVKYLAKDPRIAIIYLDKPIDAMQNKRTAVAQVNGKTGVYFTHKNKRFAIQNANTKHIVSGERFKVTFDSLNPKRSELHLEEPVFFATDSVITTKGIITSVNELGCSFKYWEDDYAQYIKKPWKKAQAFYFGSRIKYDIHEGSRFEVKYLASNPKIAIIYFDKPITK